MRLFRPRPRFRSRSGKPVPPSMEVNQRLLLGRRDHNAKLLGSASQGHVASFGGATFVFEKRGEAELRTYRRHSDSEATAELRVP